MSVIGISPTDIVKGGKILKDATTALKSGPEGAMQQFQDAHSALSSLEQAAADLAQCEAAGDQSNTIYNGLLERERRFCKSLQAYDKRLGPDSKTKPLAAIKQKLRYAFDGAPKVQKHIITSKPGVDAALFHTMRNQSEMAIKNHEQTVQIIRDGIASVTGKVDAIGPDMIARLSQAIARLPHEHSETVKEALKYHWESNKLDVSRLINEAVAAGITSSAYAEADRSQIQMPRLHNGQEPDDESLTNRHENPIRAESSIAKRNHFTPIVPQAQHAAAHISHDTSPVISRIFLFLLSISTVALYQNPTARKALASCVPAYHRDPVSLTLLLLTVLAFTNCFVSLPLQVSLLTDNLIFLDTALGEPLKVPRYYWESFDIFHGFLATHFATRPGQMYVKARRYRILLGGATGQILDVSKWHTVVSARMKLVMALLIDGLRSDCPKCLVPLSHNTETLNYCAACDRFYQSVYTDHSERAIDDGDMDSSNKASLGSRGNSSELGFTRLSKQRLGPTRANEPSSQFELDADPGDLQHFVHMLLSKSEKQTPPSTPVPKPGKSHTATKDLDLLVEALYPRMIKWDEDIKFDKFGSLVLYGDIVVGRPQGRLYTVESYLFEKYLIFAREKKGPLWPPIKIRNREFSRCHMKGFVNFKNLTELSQEGSLVLTLHLSVEVLPTINIYFSDVAILERWRSAISRAAAFEDDHDHF